MILRIVLIVMGTLYLLFGLFLFVKTVLSLGGMKESGYDNTFRFVLGAVTVSICWPIFLITGSDEINEEAGDE